jgi:hypothetical protein
MGSDLIQGIEGVRDGQRLQISPVISARATRRRKMVTWLDLGL